MKRHVNQSTEMGETLAREWKGGSAAIIKVCVCDTRSMLGSVLFMLYMKEHRKGEGMKTMNLHRLHRFHCVASWSQNPLEATPPLGLPDYSGQIRKDPTFQSSAR